MGLRRGMGGEAEDPPDDERAEQAERQIDQQSCHREGQADGPRTDEQRKRPG